MHAGLGKEPDGYERDLRWVAGDLGEVRRYKKVRKVTNTLSEDSAPEHFHDLRKKAKRLRYAAPDATSP